MAKVLSIRLQEDIYELVKKEPMQPRGVITLALKMYFRFKNKDVVFAEGEFGDVPPFEAKLPDGTTMFSGDKDLDMIKLEVENEYLQSRVDDLLKDKTFLQNQLHLIRMDRMDKKKLGFFRRHFLRGRTDGYGEAEPGGNEDEKVRVVPEE